MKPRYGLFVLILCCVSGLLNAQVSAKKLKNEGDGYFKYSKYHEALNMFLKYQRLKKEDLDVRYKIGLCYYFTNEVEEAKKYLQYVLDNNKKADPKTYYYLGRVYHSEYDFESAIKYYKQYLKETKATNLDRRSVKDAIRRCAMGLRLAYRDEIALVENLGDEVNTRGDDFAPVPSPNFNNKLYFSSSREGNIGGLRDNKGLRNEKYGDFSTDIYSTVVINGRWTATTPMSSLINSPRNDVALDFSMNGGVMYYYKGPNLAEGEILVDTFANGNEDNLIPVAFNGPVDGARRENDLYFFNDTTLLFSSRMPGGYGGDDLYLTTLRDGNWTEPENLGPMINSAYDEKTPFLAIDGRTLYFSSNNRQSIGGLDIFVAKYDDKLQEWGTPQNLARPINSAADDAYFRLSRDGMSAYFSSSRKDGFGKRDLYVAYFKSFQQAQKQASRPLLYRDVVATDDFESTSPLISGTTTPPINTPKIEPTDNNEQINKIALSPLYYTDEDQVMTSANIRELNKLARLMQDYPQIQLGLESHSEGGGPLQFSLYFSIKRAEKVAAYLIENGVDASRIMIKGLGPNYPIAKRETEAGFNDEAARYNRRIDLRLYQTANLPIDIQYRQARGGTFEDERADFYLRRTAGLSYKVQVASLKQMYNSDIFTSFADPMVEAGAGTGFYRYTLGIVKSFAAADALRAELSRKGIADAFVVPYIDGWRISKNKARESAKEYQDLNEFLNATGD